MNISSEKDGTGGELSNFHPRHFVFKGFICTSLEGLLQSFKFEKVHMQGFMCSLVGKTAKKRGQKRNQAWRDSQTLWFHGHSMKRDSRDYQVMLDEAFLAVATQDPTFQRALLDTGDEKLEHTIGSSDITNTALTEEEFCSRLTLIRAMLQDGSIKLLSVQ